MGLKDHVHSNILLMLEEDLWLLMENMHTQHFLTQWTQNFQGKCSIIFAVADDMHKSVWSISE